MRQQQQDWTSYYHLVSAVRLIPEPRSIAFDQADISRWSVGNIMALRDQGVLFALVDFCLSLVIVDVDRGRDYSI